MGLIRGGLVLILGILLFVSFLATNTFAALGSSLSYENVREHISPLLQSTATEVLNREIFGDFNLTKAAEDELNKARYYCQNTSNTEYSFAYEGYSINTSCTSVNLGRENFINESIENSIRGIYYKEYNCDFFSCFQENQIPFFLISQKAHDYWNGRFYFFLLVSLVLVALIILFMENRINAPIIIGILLALSAIPILKMSSLFSFVLGEPISIFIGIFFSQAGKVFWISFILGLVLICAGFAAKVMNLGFIKKLIQKKPEEKKSQPVIVMQQAEKTKPLQTKTRKRK